MSSFEFEKLGVWVRAMEFADMVLVLAEKTGRGERKHFRLLEQLEAAAISVPMNIAEGRGRTSPKEFLQFLSYARGSLYETVTLVSLLKKQGLDKSRGIFGNTRQSHGNIPDAPRF